MKKLALLCLFAVLFLNTLANADTLFYGGDFDPNNPNANALANENDAIVGGTPYGAATYQNFVEPNPEPWRVTGLFTNNLSQLAPTAGYWEIRQGVLEGNGGTLLASGTGAITHTPTGRSGFGYTEYKDEVALNPQPLPPGEYWFAVVPVCTTCAGRSFNSNTFGLNSVATQVSDQQFFNSSFFGANFTNADNEGVFPTFSSGVEGTVVPEPSSMIMLGTGLLAVAGGVRRRLM
jgi:hypothetical protein